MAESFCIMPDPLTPADCDLRGLPFMPLDVVRLIDSDLFAISSGDEFKAAVALWCKSWIQLPAASLPDDDRVLSHLSGAGTRWKKIRAMALKGWVKCSDGRLYHPVISEKARHAWKARLAQKARAAKRWNKEKSSIGNAGDDEAAMPDECRGISRGNARERERESITSLRSDVGCNAHDAPTEKPIADRWQELAEDVIAATGNNPARSMVRADCVRQWLADASARGYSFETATEIILGTVREKSRFGGKGKPPAWFNSPVTQALASGTIPSAHIVGNAPKSRADRVADAWAGVPDIPGV